jgi:hypothetical protein
MKKYVLGSFIAVIAISSCKESGSNLENNHRMEDTLFSTYPTVNRVTANVTDNEEIDIILGDKELYEATEEKRLKVTEEIGQMTLAIYDANNWLKKGTVIFTSDETNIDVKESLKKRYDMHIEELKSQRGK